jgi:polysaccharide deacetylase 2 family uncharacterized protein YibQ
MLDELDRPLGLNQTDPKPAEQRKPMRAAALAFAALIAAGGVWMIQHPGREQPGRGLGAGGEPEARAPIQPLPLAPRPAPAPAVAPPQVQVEEGAPETAQPAQQVEIENGVRVVRGGSAGPAIIRIPDRAGALAPAPDPRLVESSRFGLLPRRGADGATPAQVYARPKPALGAGVPRVALIVGDMGLDDRPTRSAISGLPAAVTLAFAPRGARVEALASAARDAGHEILLQSPMAPIDGADSPERHVLPAGNPPSAQDDLHWRDDLHWQDNLHWQMGRMSGYIGLVNDPGGKFTADRDSVSVVMAELAKRGLDYVDDGSAPQSRAGEAAAEQGVRFLKVDVSIDEQRRPEAIDAALFKLESLARQNGVAVGFASGLTMTNERLVRYLAGLARHGVVLVPVSAILRGGKG